MINKFNLNPFNQGAQYAPLPIAAPLKPQSTLIGAGNPFNQVSFGHLSGVSRNGPGSLLQAPDGETGLGDRAILTQNGEIGRKLYINA